MYPSPHYYFTFGGTLGASEAWSVGLRISRGSETDLTRAQEVDALDDLAGVLTSSWNDAANPTGNKATLSWAKINLLDVNGRYARTYTNVLDLTPLRSQQASTYPFQVAMVATLRTQQTRGLAAKGRIFLPHPRFAVTGDDNTMTADNTQFAATWVATLITGINGVPNLGSVVIASSVREGAMHEVVQVDVGSALDTMRSRRTNVPEQRFVAATSGGAGGSF